MSSEKRMIGEYEILAAVNIGEIEVVLASDEKNTEGAKYMCGIMERSGLFELCKDCLVSDDYIEIADLFGSRVHSKADEFQKEMQRIGVSNKVITENDCIPDHYSKNIRGKIIVIKPDVLKPEFRRADRQLYFVLGGFGASGNSRGNTVICQNIHTGKDYAYERSDVMGEIKPECLPEWAKETADKLIKEYKRKHKEVER